LVFIANTRALHTADAAVTCCGKRLAPAQAKEAGPEDHLTVETVENDYFITSGLPMEKDRYIAFTALLTEDTLFLRKHYPEWSRTALGLSLFQRQEPYRCYRICRNRLYHCWQAQNFQHMICQNVSQIGSVDKVASKAAEI